MHMWHSIWLQRQLQKKLQSTVNLLVALRVDVGLFNVFREAVTTQIASWRTLQQKYVQVKGLDTSKLLVNALDG